MSTVMEAELYIILQGKTVWALVNEDSIITWPVKKMFSASMRLFKQLPLAWQSHPRCQNH